MSLKSQTHLFKNEESSVAMSKIAELFINKAISSGLINGFVKQLVEEESKNQEQPIKKMSNLMYL